MSEQIDHVTYWRTQRGRIALLLGIWFLVGPVLSILFIEELNEIVIGGMPLGFGLAQIGSIVVFVLLIFVYAVWTGRLDRRAGVEEAPDTITGPSASH